MSVRLLTATVLGLAILCTPTAAPAPAAAAATTTLRIAMTGGDLSSEPLYAQAFGIFARHGIDARISVGSGGAVTIRDLEAGRLDVGFSNLISIAAAVQRGAPIVLLAPAGIYRRAEPVNAIVERPDGRLRSGRDLNGKTLASPSGRGSAGALAPEAWIDQHGGDSRTVRLVTGIGFFQIPAALAAHRIDVAELAEPQLTMFEQQRRVKYLASPFDAFGDGYVLAGWIASKAWVRAHPDAARRFVAAIYETARWANTHRPQTAALLAKTMHLRPSVVRAMARASYAETVTPAMLQPPLNVAARYKVIAPMNGAQLLERSRVGR